MAEAEVAPANGQPAPKVTPAGERTVPYDRFKALNDRVKTMEGDLETKNTELQTLTERAATADTLAKALETLKGEVKAKESAWGEERGLLSAGVTNPEDVDLVKFYYGRLPTEGKPKSIAEYVTALKTPEAAVPAGLSHLFAPKTTTDTTTTTTKPPPKVPAAGGDGAEPLAGAKVAAAALRAGLEKVKEGRMSMADFQALYNASKA